jgi:hypothetical protein
MSASRVLLFSTSDPKWCFFFFRLSYWPSSHLLESLKMVEIGALGWGLKSRYLCFKKKKIQSVNKNETSITCVSWQCGYCRDPRIPEDVND